MHFNRDIVVYYTHHAEHCDLTDNQRLASQHFGESLLRLIRHRDGLEAHQRGFGRNSFGFPDPTYEQRNLLFDMTQNYFQTFYATLSALIAFCNVLPTSLIGSPPFSSMARSIEWIAQSNISIGEDAHVDENLRAARLFRTILDHAPQNPPFDWITAGVDTPFDVRVVLHGRESSSGRIPDGAVRHPDHPDQWSMAAPDVNDVTNAVCLPIAHIDPLLAGMLGSEEVAKHRCTWEQQTSSDNDKNLSTTIGRALQNIYPDSSNSETAK